MPKLKRGPSYHVPESGRRHGYANRKKLIKHIEASITLLEHSLRHLKRSLERAKGERLRDYDA
jgi:hypothetical protein